MNEILELIRERLSLIIGGILAAVGGYIVKLIFDPWTEKRKKKHQEKELTSKEQEKITKQLQEIEQFAIDYKEKIRWELSKLRILDMVQSLDLEETYVQLRVQEEKPQQYSNVEQIINLEQADPNLIYELSQEENIKDNIETLRPDAALIKYRHMIVLGDPGAGKTTMLRYLCLLSANSKLNNLPDFPIFITLNRYANFTNISLLDFIFKEISERYGFPQLCSYTKDRMEKGSIIILLDGLDEVTVGSVDEAEDIYRHTANEINRIAIRYPKCPIVVTSRRAGWKGLLSPTFQIMTVLDFTQEDIIRFTNKWFKNDSNRARQLQIVLSNQVRMQALAANPLLLSLIAIVFEKDLELPERRAKLYERCVQVLLTEWDANRGIKRASSFTTDRKRDLLEEVAFHFHERGLRYFHKTELIEIIAEFLPTIDIPPKEASNILEEISAQHGLLKEQALDWYGFLHLTLQEYFTALHLSNNGFLDNLTKYFHNPWWEEVALLIAGMLRDASLLINTIMSSKDDIFFNNLLLAGRCLIGTPRIRKIGLRELVIQKLKELVENDQIHWLPRTEAVQILGEITGKNSSHYLIKLLQNKDIDWHIAASSADALGATGRKHTVSDLIKLLTEEDIRVGIRERIADALINLCDESASQDLSQILSNVNLNEKVRNRIARTLSTIRYNSTLSDLKNALFGMQAGWWIGLALSYHDEFKNLANLLSYIRNNKIKLEARWGLVRAIVDINKEQMSDIIKCLTDESIDISLRWTIARFLPENNAIAGSSDKLKNIYTNEDLNLSLRAILARAIFILGDQELVDQLKMYLANREVDDYVRWKIARTLVKLGERDIKEHILSIVLDEDFRLFMRLDLCNFLGQLADSTVVPNLISLLVNQNIDPYVRSRLADTLSSFELKNFLLDIKSLVLKEDIDSNIRSRLVYGLIRTENGAEELIDLIKHRELAEDVYLALYRLAKQRNLRIFYESETGYVIQPIESEESYL